MLDALTNRGVRTYLMKAPPPWHVARLGNKGKLIGAKPPLRRSQVWSIRTRLLIERRTRDLANCPCAAVIAGRARAKVIRQIAPRRARSQDPTRI